MNYFFPGTCLVRANTAMVMAKSVSIVVRYEGLVSIDRIYVELRSPGKEDEETTVLPIVEVEFAPFNAVG